MSPTSARLSAKKPSSIKQPWLSAVDLSRSTIYSPEGSRDHNVFSGLLDDEALGAVTDDCIGRRRQMVTKQEMDRVASSQFGSLPCLGGHLLLGGEQLALAGAVGQTCSPDIFRHVTPS